MSEGRTDARRIISVRRGGMLPVEVLVYDRGALRVFPLSPGQALALAEDLLAAARGRLIERARRNDAVSSALYDEETP